MKITLHKALNSGFLHILFLALFACSSNSDDETTTLDPPVVSSSYPGDGATDIDAGDITIVLTMDQNVTCPSSGHSSISLGDATISDVSATLTEVTIEATGLSDGTTYTLNIPADVILGPTKVGNNEINISFSTEEPVSTDITTSLCTSDPMQQAQNVYDFLLENYGENIISGTMANVAWNTNEAEWVYLQTGKYPAMNFFDYIQLPYSPANWIDYSDITVAKEWWNNNGLIGAGWHWIVPTYEGSTSYTYEPDETTFEASNATVEGTWENTVVQADLEELAADLLLLQDEGIPVFWRPLHEAAGNIYNYTGGTAWFWWGADGSDAYKALWIYMFDYFKEQGINNLIWVWTTQTEDEDFYPGDDYVDIIGRDIYSETDASAIADEFESIQETYPNKMVTLSECGSVAEISSQWSSGAAWSYFMPWYDYDRTNDTSSSEFSSTEHSHADADWWIDAVGNDNVITRDEMPDLK